MEKPNDRQIEIARKMLAVTRDEMNSAENIAAIVSMLSHMQAEEAAEKGEIDLVHALIETRNEICVLGTAIQSARNYAAKIVNRAETWDECNPPEKPWIRVGE